MYLTQIDLLYLYAYPVLLVKEMKNTLFNDMSIVCACFSNANCSYDVCFETVEKVSIFHLKFIVLISVDRTEMFSLKKEGHVYKV